MLLWKSVPAKSRSRSTDCSLWHPLKEWFAHSPSTGNSTMSERINLTGVLDLMDDKTDGEKMTVGAIMDAFGSRGFGPLLLAAALVELLPTGGIPGVPTIVAIIVILFASQMVLGRRTPWLPKKLCNKGFKHASFNKARDKIRPVTRKVDVLIKPRLTVFVTPAAARVEIGRASCRGGVEDWVDDGGV